MLAPTFPTTPGAYDTSHNGDYDAFVAKLSSDGSSLLYATFLGGSRGDDWGQGIAPDAAGNAHVTGGTSFSDFPTTAGAFDTSFNGYDDAFVAKLSLPGTVLPVNSQIIIGISPAFGPVGTLVSIIGENFGVIQNSGTVAFVATQNATSAEIVSWSDTQIQARVPSVTIGKHDVMVTTGAGTSNSILFEVTASPVLSVSPGSLDFGTVPGGGSKDLSFTVQNTGDGTLEGFCTTHTPFSLLEGCSFNLLSGQSKLVKVRFSPTGAGIFVGNVSFTSNGGIVSPTVRGKSEIELGAFILQTLIIIFG